MSECLFDPTAPGCETAQPDVASESMGPFEGTMPMGPPSSPSDLAVTRNEVLFGLATLAMTANGIKIW
jgi:hypothetical protein